MSRQPITTNKIDYSIPGKFVVIIQSNTITPHPQPPVIGHCILCLRRLRESTIIQNLKVGEALDDLKIVPEAVLPQDDLLPTFNKLLPFIHRKWKQKRKTDCFDLLIKCAPNLDSGGPSTLPKNFPHLPAMCTFCGQQIQQLDGLIKQLGGKIEEIKGIIKKSKMPRGEYGWRQQQFEEDLRNNEDLNEMSRKKTMDFLEEFGEVDEKEEDDVELDEEEVVVEATGGEEGVEEDDPLAFVEEEVEESKEFVVKVEVEGDLLENFGNEEDEKNGDEDWLPEFAPEVKMEPESELGPSETSRKRARRNVSGPASKTGRQARTTRKIISDSFGERREEGLRRSSRITIDKSRTLCLSSSSSSSSPFVKVKEPDEFSFG